MPPDRILDASGLSCPLPVLRAARLLREMKAGQILQVLSTDARSEKEITEMCKLTGNHLNGLTQTDGVLEFLIEKA